MTHYESRRYEMLKAIGDWRVVMRRMTLVMCTGSMIGCAHVQATQSWPELVHQLSNGKTVAVTTADQGEVAGTVSAVSSDSLTLVIDRASRRFEAKDVRQVRRDGDPLWNGLAIGGGVGLLGAILPDNKCSGQPLRCDDRQIPQRAAFLAAAISAGIGIDALHRDRTVLYRSPSRVSIRLVPALTAESKSVSIAISTR
ncbi:MAG TPA: hypothetical protein VF456_14175 [Vicinamibacterales bacterium]